MYRLIGFLIGMLATHAWAACPTIPTDCVYNPVDKTVTGWAGILGGPWTTAGRPTAPATGIQGFNTSLGVYETWNGTSWTAPAGSGTVTSVGLLLPSSIFTVSGAPVTTAGTLTGTLATQAANTVWAGPANGSVAGPTFRGLVGTDLPLPGSGSLGGVQSVAAVTHQFVTSIPTNGIPTLAQPAFTDIGGILSPAQGGTGVNNGTNTITTSLPFAITGSGAQTFFFGNSGVPWTYNFPQATATLDYQVGAYVNGHCLQASGTAGGIADSGAACGSSGGVTWPASGTVVISNSTSSPTGVAPSGTNCLVSSGGTWTTGACGGASGLTIGATAITSGTTGRVLIDTSGTLQELAYGLTGNSTIVETTAAGAITPSLIRSFSDSGATLISTASPTVPVTYAVAMFDPTANAISAAIQACNGGSTWDQWFKDATGQAATHIITLTPSAGTIDGAATAQIGTAYGALHIHSNGGACVIL